MRFTGKFYFININTWKKQIIPTLVIYIFLVGDSDAVQLSVIDRNVNKRKNEDRTTNTSPT